MIECAHCGSTEIRIIESYDDGADIIDVEFECRVCGEVQWTATSDEEVQESDYDE